MSRLLRTLGIVQLVGMGACAILLSSKGDESTCAHPQTRSTDGPPCPTCGQNIEW